MILVAIAASLLAPTLVAAAEHPFHVAPARLVNAALSIFEGPPQRTGPGFNDGEDIFAFGDSLTVANGGNLARDGSDSYVYALRDEILPNGTADHNMDGAGQSSAWGLQHVNKYLPREGRNKVFFFAFGANDRRDFHGNLSAEETVANLAAIYEVVEPYADQVIIGVTVLHACPSWDLPMLVQRQWLSDVEAGLAERGLPFVRLYDALDSNPGNEAPDAWEETHFADCIHPDMDGNAQLGAYIARHLAPND